MYHNRLIPCLLLRGHGLVKTEQFKKGRYLGDPINAVKIFNDREVDELFVLDIDATRYGHHPDFDYLKKITQQCFMPVGYGGGVSSIEDVMKLFEIGFEKVSVCSAYNNSPELIKEASDLFGSQSIVGAIDVRDIGSKKWVCVRNGLEKVTDDVVGYAKSLVESGAGELFINSIDRDGMMQGYDVDLISLVSSSVDVPIVACGGAGTITDCSMAINAGASAVAAGSIFVYWGRKKAVLINYPNSEDITF